MWLPLVAKSGWPDHVSLQAMGLTPQPGRQFGKRNRGTNTPGEHRRLGWLMEVGGAAGRKCARS